MRTYDIIVTQKPTNRSMPGETSTAKASALDMKMKRNTIYRYIKTHPRQTIYSISNNMDIPMSTVRKLVYELVEFEKAKFETVTEKGRNKNIIIPLTNPIFDEVFDYFLFESFFNENIGKRERLLAEQALKSGLSITIEMPDHSKQEIKPGEDIDKFLDSQHFAMTSKFT